LQAPTSFPTAIALMPIRYVWSNGINGLFTFRSARFRIVVITERRLPCPFGFGRRHYNFEELQGITADPRANNGIRQILQDTGSDRWLTKTES
jgi:hypothetical protein